MPLLGCTLLLVVKRFPWQLKSLCHLSRRGPARAKTLGAVSSEELLPYRSEKRISPDSAQWGLNEEINTPEDTSL